MLAAPLYICSPLPRGLQWDQGRNAAGSLRRTESETICFCASVSSSFLTACFVSLTAVSASLNLAFPWGGHQQVKASLVWDGTA